MPPKIRKVGAYAKLLANYAADDAIMEAGEAAELLFVRGLAFCSTSDSDGFISDQQVIRYVGAGMRDAKKRAERLAEVGVWERKPGGYLVRSWTKIHDTAEEKGRRLRTDRERKRTERGHETVVQDVVPSDSERIPSGQTSDSVSDSLSLIHDTTQQDRTLLPEAPPSGRKRDELWEAVIDACGLTGVALTKSARGAANDAVKQLRDVGADPSTVGPRAARYRQRYPQATLTPSALAKQWSNLGVTAVAGGGQGPGWQFGMGG